ncbi:DUF6869 domain-containing protein [Leisingera sp. ANG59]|uniref:DUF6869 domain-containing protein n=1 Tax=Leisingera sp. ANG59 TaxID=2675221 RepID=UPI001572F228|nr:hypothetical protein [Leisingera sp. ANG59]NSY38533.1 hypothetical protein [Leisingera sp. ANG59]
MSSKSLTAEELLAVYWLRSEELNLQDQDTLEKLRSFVRQRKLQVTNQVLENACDYLHSGLSKGDVEQWIVFICFWANPNALWNFTIDAMAAAENDDDLGRIAVGLAEHILAHYGSMMPYFEARASVDPDFKRMLTGVWRHRMSDDVWMRLRALQAEVPNPLGNMIPLEKGVEHMAHSLKPDDRANDDKGRYQRDNTGEWQVARRIKRQMN